jgi:hypothetical protein
MTGQYHRRFSGRGGIRGALVLIAAVAVATPAFAQDRDHDRGPDPHEVRHQERHHGGREHHAPVPDYGYGVPTLVPNPPPIVYAPPAPSAGISLMFNFR